MRNCFAYVAKPRRLCVCIFSTTIAGVSFIKKLSIRVPLKKNCSCKSSWKSNLGVKAV